MKTTTQMEFDFSHPEPFRLLPEIIGAMPKGWREKYERGYRIAQQFLNEKGASECTRQR